MSKVYCKDCRYYFLGSLEFRVPSHCVAPTGKIITDYIRGDYAERINLMPDDDGYPNNRKTNGCKLYRRSWWKFWADK